MGKDAGGVGLGREDQEFIFEHYKFESLLEMLSKELHGQMCFSLERFGLWIEIL